MKYKTIRYKIHEIGEVIAGGTPRTTNESYWGDEVAWITPKDLSAYRYRYVSRGERMITKVGLQNSSAKLMPKNSVLFTSRAPIGYVAIAQNELCTNQGFKSIVCDPKKINYKYMYYWLKNKTEDIKLLSNGSTFQEISGSTMKNLNINLPDLEIQLKVVEILDSIDLRIELNNKLNDNLDKQGFILYRKFFIEGYNKEWKTGTISDIGDVVGGSTPSKAKEEYYCKKGIAWITPKDLSNNKHKFVERGDTDITEIGLKNSSVKMMPRGTVLFSSRAPIGYIAIAKGVISTNQGFKSIVPFENINTAYVYYYLKDNLKKIENMASGSTFKEISGTTLKGIEAVIPDKNRINEFNKLCNPIFSLQEVLEEQIISLEKLRDTLLPKLMSGKINLDSIDLNTM